jgi:hypothetical protein
MKGPKKNTQITQSQPPISSLVSFQFEHHGQKKKFDTFHFGTIAKCLDLIL